MELLLKVLTARSYYWQWIKTASTHSLGQFDLWAGLGGILLAIVDHYLPEKQFAANISWQLPIWILAVIAVARVLIAPYWLAQAQDKLLASYSPDDKAAAGQLKFLNPIFKRDLEKVGDKNLMIAAQVAIELRNDAPFEITYTIIDFDTVIAGNRSSNKNYPNSIDVPIQSGQNVTYNSEAVPLPRLECGEITGEIQFKISYGLPNREVHRLDRGMRFKIKLNANCNIVNQEWSWIRPTV